MVLQNRLEYEFGGGDKVHAMPHFPKSFKVMGNFDQFLHIFILTVQTL